MTRYQYEEPVSPDFSHSWIQGRLEQLERHFRDFLTSKEGRFYVLFGGRCAGKTSLLQIIHQRFPPEPGSSFLSVSIDLATAGVLSSSKDFFRLLFTEIRNQLDVCYIDSKEEARLFQDDGLVLSDFKQAFSYIAWSPESKVRGARLLLLLDNADKLAQASFASELFTDLVALFSNATYIRHVTSQLDVVATGGVPLYNQLLETKFSRELKHWYNIEALPKDATQALIENLPAIRNQPDLIGEIMRYTGGQPYLLQYFMAQLEDLTPAGQPVTGDAVKQVIIDCLQPRSKLVYWFHKCFEAIEEQRAHPVYAALATDQTMTWAQIKATIQEQKLGDTAPFRDPVAVDRALDVLLFHGLVRYDQASGYVITSELFKQWFVNNILSPEERGKITMYQEWAMSILTTAVPMLYDILKWLRQERERDREEGIEPSPPPEILETAPAEAAQGTPASTPDALLAVLKEADLAEERATLDRLGSLGRQLENHRKNINLYEEALAEIPVGRERLSLRRDCREERETVERITQEMQEILERLSGHRVVVAE